jgi:hypothetical protein
MIRCLDLKNSVLEKARLSTKSSPIYHQMILNPTPVFQCMKLPLNGKFSLLGLTNGSVGWIRQHLLILTTAIALGRPVDCPKLE